MCFQRFIQVVRTSLSSFTHFQHRTARVARYSIPLRYIPYRATFACPNAHPLKREKLIDNHEHRNKLTMWTENKNKKSTMPQSRYCLKTQVYKYNFFYIFILAKRGLQVTRCMEVHLA